MMNTTAVPVITPVIQNIRIRIMVVLSALLIAVSVLPAPVLMGICLVLVVAMLWCGISLRYIVQRYALIVPFALGALIFMPFVTPGETAFQLWIWSASLYGLVQAYTIFLKITVANLLISYLLATTTSFEIIKHLKSFGVPDLLIMIMQMMIRYFYLLVEEIQTMLKAQRARGLQVERWFWSPLVFKRIGELLGVLFIRSYVRSQKIYMAMAARGGLPELSTPQYLQTQIRKEVVKMAIELQKVSFCYGNYQALRDITFSLPRGAKTALLGGNGAGKSTLISLLNGLAAPASGKVFLFGELLTRDTQSNACQRVGVVYQDPDDQIFSATVEEDVAFGPRNLGLPEAEVEARISRALASVGLREFRQRSPFELSYGQKRRVAIAGVLAMQPEVIIMDEPMAFLDPQGRIELQALLESLHLMGMTILIATHDIDFAAEWADRVLILQNGSVYAEGSHALLFDEQLLSGAQLPLPRLAQPFRMLRDIPSDIRPRNVREAAQWIWRLMIKHEQHQVVSEPALHQRLVDYS